MPGRVLDTSAILAVLEAEPGADEVDRLVQARQEMPDAPTTEIIVAFISLMEVEYRLVRRLGDERTAALLLMIEHWPVTVEESTPAWRHQAARIKARFRLSVADAWIAALALMRDAELVHKDPEFDQIPDLKAIRLPYKQRQR